VITASASFLVDSRKIPAKGCGRRLLPTEAAQLGVMTVAAGASFENSESEKSFPPECHEAAGIEVLGVEAPESHGRGKNRVLVVRKTGGRDIERVVGCVDVKVMSGPCQLLVSRANT